MTVERILAEKGHDVITIGPERTLLEAAHLLAERRIGAVVVARDDNSVCGILSERDIVRALARLGAAALDTPVSRTMTAEVKTSTPKMHIDEVMEMMTTGKFRHVPICDGPRLVGIVSIGDVVKHRLAQVEAEQAALRDYIATA